MNKKIILSTVAAATLAITITGCGSDENASSSTVSGVAVKAQLSGANVTFGGVTVQTDANGSFTVSGDATGNLITISGGSYIKDGVEKNNTAPIIATKAQVNAGVEASVLTTLISKFGGDTNATKQAFALLNIPYVTGVNLADKKAASFEDAAISTAFAMEAAEGNTSALADIITSLQTTAKTAADLNQSVTPTALNTAIKTAATAGGVSNARLDGILDAVRDGKSFKFIVEKIAVLDKNASATDVNSTVNTYNPSAYQLASSIDINATDSNATHSFFTLVDNNASFVNANGNTSLFVSIEGLDAANVNSSYAMALTGLDIETNTTSSYVILKDTNNSVLTTLVGTTLNKKITESTIGSKIDAIYSNGRFLTESSSTQNSFNVSKFTSYMDSAYEERDVNGTTPVYGSVHLANGNYSVSVSVNVNGQTITKNNKVTSVVGSSLETKDYNGNAVFTGVTGYKIIDANLTK